MSEYYLQFMVFLAVSVLIYGFYRYYSIDIGFKNAVNDRLEILKKTNSQTVAQGLLHKKRGLSLLDNYPKLNETNVLFIQSGLDLGKIFFIKFISLIFFTGLFIYILVGFKWYAPLIIVIVPILLTYFYIAHARSNRISAFEKQLPEALDIIVRSLRAGHPTVAAIGLAARECPDPLGSEFRIAYDEMQHGLDITPAINNMCNRVGMLDLVYVQAAIAVQTQSGGSLSDIMARLSVLIKDRFKLRQKVLALTSEGRISGLVLTFLPVVIFIVISFITPTYYGDIYSDPLTMKAFVLSICLLIIGHLYIQYLLNFKY